MKNRNTIFTTTVLGLACFAFLPGAQAVSPAPDACYPNFTTAEGCDALKFLSTGAGNTGVGWRSLYLVGDASFNTGVGAGTLLLNTADFNTAVGAFALFSNIDGADNTATGFSALVNNTEGGDNTANGYQALFSNATGIRNTANGALALLSNTIGSYNTADGALALYSNAEGDFNTATGAQALFSNTIGTNNTAVGTNALYSNTIGTDNTAFGTNALNSNTEGDFNTAIGRDALLSGTTGSFNTAVGYRALVNTTGSFNIGLRGGSNLTTGNFNIDIGSDGVAGESGTIRIGDGCCQSRAFMAGISGTAVSGSTVVVDANGQLGVAPSSARFKQQIQPMDETSEAILSLKPVSFHYNKEIDPERTPQFGLVAEEVEKINPNLVAHDRDGKPFTVRYDAVNAMLLNEFLKAHQTIEGQTKTLAQQTKQIAELTAAVKEIGAKLQVNQHCSGVANND